MAANLVGSCYVLTGQITQGMGMIHSIRDHCRKSGEFYVESFAKLSLGILLNELGRSEEAIKYLRAKCDMGLKEAKEKVEEWGNELGI